MATSLDKLMLTVGLLDRITGPMKGIQKTIQKVTSNSRKAFMNTAAGVTALIAASSTFAATVNPANDMNNALNEVSSLDVANSTLASLNQAGLKYSIQFGESASNYVRSAYDIQSAIDGLAGDDLPRFTTAAGTLAKATKANVSDITNYFGTMYGIFKNQANEMGKGNWVEMLAGQTAKAVQMFKTTGPEMSAAFGAIGADATTMGVKLNEQMAVLGSLQSTMSGSEAGTKYGAFLQGLSGAQGKLGLSFTDDSGALLPVVEILDKIKEKTKGLGALQMQDVLSGAFGSDEAVSFIKLMSTDVNKLSGDIDKLGNVTGMKKAIDMAKKMRDPWAQVAAGFSGVSIAIWQKALPAINPMVDAITNVTLVIVEWTNKYPHLTKLVGLAATAFIGFVAVAGLMSITIGLARYAMVGFTMRFILIKPIVWAARLVMLAWTGALWLARTAMLAFVLYGPAMSALFVGMKASVLSSLPAIWAFTAALLANPLTWVVVGIVALIAAIAGLVIYWDQVTAAVSKGWSWLKGLFENNAWMKVIFAPIYLGITAVDLVIKAFQKIPQWWGEFQVWLGGVSLMPSWNLGIDTLESIKSWWADFKAWLLKLDPFAFLEKRLEWIKNKLGGLREAFENNAWMKIVFAPIYLGITAVDLVIKAFQKIPQWWGDFQVWLGGVSLMPSWDLGMDAFESIKSWWIDFKGWLSKLDPFAFLGEKVDWLKNKLSWLPGIDVSGSEVSDGEARKESASQIVTLPGSDVDSSGGESGGLFQTISNMFGGSKKSVTVEKMEVNNHGKGVRGDDLAYELEMAAG